jgi:hypothetical protein
MSRSAPLLLEDPVAAAPADVDPLDPALVDTVGIDPAFKVAVPVTDDEARVLGGKAVLACNDYGSSVLSATVHITGFAIYPAILRTSRGGDKTYRSSIESG